MNSKYFLWKCDEIDKLRFPSSWECVEDFSLTVSGSRLIIRLLFFPSSFCLWNKETTIKKRENSQLCTITVVLDKFRVQLKVLEPCCPPARWAVQPCHLQSTFTSPLYFLRGTVPSDWGNRMKNYLYESNFRHIEVVLKHNPEIIWRRHTTLMWRSSTIHATQSRTHDCSHSQCYQSLEQQGKGSSGELGKGSMLSRFSASFMNLGPKLGFFGKYMRF